MKFKEKLRLCFQVLFKGRDINKELQVAEEKEKEIAEKMTAQLELLINSAKRGVMADANSTSNCYELPIYDIKIAPLEISPQFSTHGDIMDMHLLQLERVHQDYRITDHRRSVTSMVERFYEEAAHRFAKFLISKKILRVDTFRDKEDFNSVILRFTAEFYKP